MRAELPGARAEDVHVSVDNDILTVRGERKLEQEDKRAGYHRIERSYGSFARSFALPANVDGEHVDAEMRDGVLTVRLPKKRIEVKSGGGQKQPIKPGKPS